MNWKQRCELMPYGCSTKSKMPSRYVEGFHPIQWQWAGGSHCRADGREYIDYTLGLGAVILGYQDKTLREELIAAYDCGSIYSLPCEAEGVLAEMIVELVPSAEQVQFVNSGTEACQAAVKIARAATGRERIAACYDPQTELLTADGFKPVSKVAVGENVATLNPRTGDLEYHLVENTISYHHSGEMIHFTGHSCDLMVTPDHKIYRQFRSRTNERSWRLTEAEKEAGRKSATMMTAGCQWNCTDVITVEIPRCLSPESRRHPGKHPHLRTKGIVRFPVVPFLKFLAWYLTEGCLAKRSGRVPEISIAQDPKTNPEKVAEIHAVLKELGLNPYQNAHHVIISSKELAEYLAPLGKNKDKHVPHWVKQLSPKLLMPFAETMVKGDGTFENGRMRKFYTTSPRLADDMQEIFFKLGRPGCLTKRKNVGFKPGGEIYHLSIGDGSPQSTARTAWAQRVPYDGMVYCVTVPNHIVLTRRNGKVVWSGNCGYHGWAPWYSATSPDSMGCTEDEKRLTTAFEYNNMSSLDAVLRAGPVPAAVIMEPLVFDLPRSGFLQAVREACTRRGIVLIFDEVVTGLRMPGLTAQKHSRVIPDLTCMGKCVTNGEEPFGLVCGKRDLMQVLTRGCFVSSTYAGNPKACRMALATIRKVQEFGVVERVWDYGEQFAAAFTRIVDKAGLAREVSIRGLPCRTFFQFPTEEHKGLFWQECAKNGVWFGYAQFVSYAHSQADLDQTEIAMKQAMAVVARHWDNPAAVLEGEPPQATFRLTVHDKKK